MSLDSSEQLVAEALRAVNDSISEARYHIEKLEAFIHAELAELDHAKASKRQVEELHTRLDQQGYSRRVDL